jgi:hypothetical protein
MPKKKNTLSRPDMTPYLDLLDVEVAGEIRKPPTRSSGRPKSPFVKKRVNLILPEEQLKWLDKIVEALEQQMGREISRGLLVAFMTTRIYITLQTSLDENGQLTIPDTVKSFSSFAAYLDELGIS